ncbi:MAG: hypothetical protein QOH88_3588 [Verrucomicrobiota bacterium]|jgi:glycosyltransferase involved in cell wall biosynthesis
MADVSIIIPTYNRLWSLPQALDSCRGNSCQTEIIVVDDGSTDETWEWLQQQPDVIAIRQENLGKDWAVNHGFAVASGEFIRFLDSDDWSIAGATDAQLKLGREAGADIVVAGYSVFSESGELLRNQPWVPCDDFIAQQLGECDGSHYSAFLIRRNFIAGLPHRQEAGIRDDRLFVLEMALKGPKVATYNQCSLGHRHHSHDRLQFPSGLRASVTNYQHLAIYRRILGELDARGELTQRRKSAAVRILWPLAHWIAYSHPGEAAEVAEWIYRLEPDFTPPEAGLLGWMYSHLGFRRTEQLLLCRRTVLRLLRLRSRGVT